MSVFTAGLLFFSDLKSKQKPLHKPNLKKVSRKPDENPSSQFGLQ